MTLPPLAPCKAAPLAPADAARWLAASAGVLWLAGALAVLLGVILRAIVFTRRMRSAHPGDRQADSKESSPTAAPASVFAALLPSSKRHLWAIPRPLGPPASEIILPQGLAARLSDERTCLRLFSTKLLASTVGTSP